MRYSLGRCGVSSSTSAARASGDAGLERYLAPGLPAVLPEEVGDAADRVGRAAAQIDDAVAVEIDRKAPRTARHELRDADRPGVGAAHGEDVDAAFAHEEQVMLELIAEIRRARRVVEGESGERVEHAPAAGVAAIEGLHADDRDHVFGRHAVLALRALERLAVGVPERDAVGNAPLGEEGRAVFLPGAALRRSLHRLQHRLGALRAREHGKELALDETVALDQLADERAHLRAFRIAGLLRERRGNQRQESEAAFHVSRSSRTRRRSRAAVLAWEPP